MSELLNATAEEIIFVDQYLYSIYKCPICQRVFRDPVVAQCGHTFCRRCTSPPTVCSYDEQTLQAFASNHVVAEQINSALVWCKYGSKRNERDEHTCPVKIPLQNKKEHEDQCPYRPISCPNGCPVANLRQKDLSNHLYICSHRDNLSTNSTEQIHEQFLAKMSQLDLLSEYLSATDNDHLDDETGNRYIEEQSRNTSELMKTKQTSPIPTTIDDQESSPNLDSDIESDLPRVILRCHGTFTGHNDTVWCLYAIDDVLLSGSSDKTVKVWNLRETPYTNLETLHGHSEGVLSLTARERTVFSGGADKSICVWSLDDYRQISSFTAHTDQVCSLTQYNNHLYSSSNKCLKIWDMERLNLINEIPTDAKNGWLRVLMQKDACIYAGCRRVIKVFDSLTQQLSFEFELPMSESIYSLAHSDTLLFAGSYSGAIYVWDTRANRCFEQTCRHTAAVHGLCVRELEKSGKPMLVSASSDKTIRVWSIETFEQIQYDERHEAEVTALHGNVKYIMSGGTDAKIKVWECLSSYEPFE